MCTHWSMVWNNKIWVCSWNIHSMHFGEKNKNRKFISFSIRVVSEAYLWHMNWISNVRQFGKFFWKKKNEKKPRFILNSSKPFWVSFFSVNFLFILIKNRSIFTLAFHHPSMKCQYVKRRWPRRRMKITKREIKWGNVNMCALTLCNINNFSINKLKKWMKKKKKKIENE